MKPKIPTLISTNIFNTLASARPLSEQASDAFLLFRYAAEWKSPKKNILKTINQQKFQLRFDVISAICFIET